MGKNDTGKGTIARPQQRKPAPPPKKRKRATEDPFQDMEPGRQAEADQAKLTAAGYCLLHYPTLYTAGVPRPAPGPRADLWIVPIVVTDPVQGVVAQVGELTIKPKTGQIVSSTPRAAVITAGKHAYRTRCGSRRKMNVRRLPAQPDDRVDGVQRHQVDLHVGPDPSSR